MTIIFTLLNLILSNVIILDPELDVKEEIKELYNEQVNGIEKIIHEIFDEKELFYVFQDLKEDLIQGMDNIPDCDNIKKQILELLQTEENSQEVKLDEDKIKSSSDFDDSIEKYVKKKIIEVDKLICNIDNEKDRKQFSDQMNVFKRKLFNKYMKYINELIEKLDKNLLADKKYEEIKMKLDALMKKMLDKFRNSAEKEKQDDIHELIDENEKILEKN